MIGWPNLLSKKESNKVYGFIDYPNAKIEAPLDVLFTSIYLPSSEVIARCIRICILEDKNLYLNLF